MDKNNVIDTLKEIKKEKRMLELSLASAISSIVREFTDSTGIEVESVSVNTVEVSTIVSDNDQYVISGVSVGLSL